jgi:hypothetical protein
MQTITVKTRSGRTFEIHELTALESNDALALAPTAMTTLHSMMAKAITSIDGVPAAPIKSVADLRRVLNGLKHSELNEIRKAYDHEFELTDEDLGNESERDEQPVSS